MKTALSVLLLLALPHLLPAAEPVVPPYDPAAIGHLTAASVEEVLGVPNLHAWCVPPFDAKKRGPVERAEMLQKLGFKHFVYDWRPNDIPTFDTEIEELQKRGIELRGWWSPTSANDPVLKQILEVFKRHEVHPQLWVMGSGAPTKTPEEQRQRVEQEAERIRQIVEVAKPYGCKVELYNHGGWFGQPDNEVSVVQRLKEIGVDDVGMIYNFSHGHGDIADFAAIWKRIKPYVVTVNVTGMVENGESKIMPPSQGKFEVAMMKIVLESGWRGPVGVIGEQGGDAEITLGNYLRGLEWCKKELVQPGSGGAPPSFASSRVAATNAGRLAAGRFGKALDASEGGGLLVPGKDEWRQAPITIEAWAKLRSAKNFNVIVASDTKASAAHWELYSYAGSGEFAVFLPGQGGEIRSGVKICDDTWHYLGVVLEQNRFRLYVDGQLTKEKALPARGSAIVPAELAIGRTVEDGIGCDGLIDDVRISRGIRDISSVPAAALSQDAETLGLWALDELPKIATALLPEREPLDPAAHSLASNSINRDRIYDFYAKQARDYSAAAEKPQLLPAYPGLDGGRFGHWGNQTEANWNNNRWNQMDVGSVQGGVFRAADRTVARAVCVRLGDAAACFDPETLTWPEAWSGGFVRFGTARFGFLGGVAPGGKPMAAPKSEPAAPGQFKYHGYYRYGPQVVFAYQRDGAEWLESASNEVGSVVATRERAGEGKLSALTRGGPAQWPQVFETTGTLGSARPYAIDSLTLPADTPWHSLWHFGGLDFLPNGEAALCTFEGEVWIVSGIDDKLQHLHWKRFASGLHEALGLNVVDGKICVLGRDQITRLHDLNNDGEADFYECFANSYETPTGGHDFVTGLQHDSEGRFYLASGKQGVVRVTPGSTSAEVLATGFRNPDGIGLGPRGEVAVAVQEGDWTPASMLYEFIPKPGVTAGHYGYGGPKPGPRGHLPPLAYLPRGVDHSCGGQCYVQGDRWGALPGTLIHFSWGNGSAFLVLREELRDTAQGTVLPLPGDFTSGAHRGAFRPLDGQLYVAGMTGWITYTPDDGCLQRMRYTGDAVKLPIATEARDNGVLLHFKEPLDPAAADAHHYFAQEWSYRYSSAYGSEEYSVRAPDQKGHDPLIVTSAHLCDGGRALFLEIPQLQPANSVHLHCELPDLLSRDFYLTVHQLGLPFTDFEGYHAIAKAAPDPHAAHHMAAMASGSEPKPVVWEKGSAGRELHLQTASGLQFAQKELHAAPGERLSLVFENPDAMPHNWVLVKIGSVERVGDLANKLITDPDAVARSYVPESPDVLVHTRILDPQKTTTIHFNAPAQPGRYPYICTFPGHWMLMKGELVVN